MSMQQSNYRIYFHQQWIQLDGRIKAICLSKTEVLKWEMSDFWKHFLLVFQEPSTFVDTTMSTMWLCMYNIDIFK